MPHNSDKHNEISVSHTPSTPREGHAVWLKTLKILDELSEAKSVLNHPFYLAWQKGELPREAIAEYATHYYHYIAAFPTHISALHSRCDDIRTRQVLLHNLMEEELTSDNHPELWLRFAEGMGVARETVFATRDSSKSHLITRTFYYLTRTQSLVAGLAGLYAYERQMPAISKVKMESLTRFYDVSDRRTLSYFRVHAEVDIRHAEEARQLLKMHLNTEQDSHDAINGSVEIADAFWKLLTDIGRRYDLAPPGEPETSAI